MSKENKIRRRHRNYFITIPGLLLILGLVGSTIAWLTSQSSATNSFDTGEVSATVTETFNDYTKSNVAVQNTGNVPVYIRAVVVVSFINDTTHQITGDEPVIGQDYSITYSNSSNWTLGSDGFYYYSQPVSPNASTDILINSATQLLEYSGRTLHVEIATQAIQAEPTTAVTSAWGVTINSNTGELTAP